MRTEAAASAEQVTITAEAAVEAEGRTLLHEASNKLNKDQIELARIQAVIDGLPAIIKEAAEPIMKSIDSLRVIDLNGLNQSESSSGGENVTGAGNMADHAVNSMLRYRTQKPVVDALLSELGLNSLDDLSNITSGILNKKTSGISE